MNEEDKKFLNDANDSEEGQQTLRNIHRNSEVDADLAAVEGNYKKHFILL